MGLVVPQPFGDEVHATGRDQCHPWSEGEVTTTFEWVLDRAFVLQRVDAPAPIPQGLCVIGEDKETGAYTQHYFDSAARRASMR
jgi:hypothetical protein